MAEHIYLHINCKYVFYGNSFFGSLSFFVCRSFVAELSFFVKQLGRTIHGRDTGSNKQQASKSCALSLVRQLFHLGVIEAFSGTLKKEKSAEQMKPYQLRVSPQLQNQVAECLSELNIEPIVPKSEAADQAVSLLSTHVVDDFVPSVPTPAGVVPWSPPQPNWNPWTGCNIDEGPLATASLESLSEQLMSESRRRLQDDTDLQRSIKDRNILPVFSKRSEIMELINENPVIIVRGNTGCGMYLQSLVLSIVTIITTTVACQLYFT